MSRIRSIKLYTQTEINLILQINDSSLTATDISQVIKESVESSDEEGLYGGSIVLLVSLYDDLLRKREGELSQEYGYNFTINMLESASVMQESVTGFNEIHDQNTRYRTSSSILSFVDNLGSLYISEVPCSEKIELFATKNVQMMVRTTVTMDDTKCFHFNGNLGQNSICFPHSSLLSAKLNCTTFVSSFFSLDNKRSGMFPNYVSRAVPLSGEVSSLSASLLGLTVNNQSLALGGSAVRLEFHHPEGGGRACVWWDPTRLAWSTSGCQVSQAETNLTTTVCLCDHLTNFGVMFDYQGRADPNDPVLSTLSTVLLSLSSLSILLTQTFLALTK